VLAAGCGSDDKPTRAETAVPPPASRQQAPNIGTQAASRKQRPKASRPPSQPRSKPYRCAAKELRALEPTGPVRIDPNPVDAGARFDVVVIDPSAQVAVVSLAGVSDEPIRADAEKRGVALVATLRMPAGASCGNKLVTVEGDVSVQAYVAVRR
jgi:hypothetical protein